MTVAVLVWSALSFGCSRHAVAVQNSATSAVSQSSQVRKVVTLPSGYRLNLIQVGPIYSTTTHKLLALMVSYQTSIPLVDIAALGTEADGIFKYVRTDAEREGYSAVVLSATEPATGFGITQSSGYRFVYHRSTSGAWSRATN